MIFKALGRKKEEKWNSFVVKNSGSFLQSYQWGEFQKTFGRKIWRVEIEENLKALVVKHGLPLKRSYLYCPQGPVLKQAASGRKKTINLFLKKVRKIAKEERSIFFKIEPLFGAKILGNDFIKSEKEIQPSQTTVLDIAKTEEDLLKQMGQKTRYNINLSRRKGVVIDEASSNSKSALNAFWNLLEKTAEKDNFYTHQKKYYQKMFDFLGRGGLVKLFLAKDKRKIIAAGIFSFYGETAVYMHGASDYSARRLMAPYLLQWQAILKAKKLGLKYYDFGGIDEKKWPGVTRFKKGFGGKEIVRSGAFDLVFKKWWYSAYNIVRRIL